MKAIIRVLKLYVADCLLLAGALLFSYGVYLFDARLGLMCCGCFSLAAGVLIAKGER
jgi:hypothetical protein